MPLGRAAEGAGKGQDKEQGVGRDAVAGGKRGHAGTGSQQMLPLQLLAFPLVMLQSHAHCNNPQSKSSFCFSPSAIR